VALKITFEPNEILDYLRVDSGDDETTIDQMKEEAMGEAEDFLNTDFHLIVIDPVTNEVVKVEQEAPIAVKSWVKNRIAEKYENRGQEPPPDFTTIKGHRVLPFRG